jgi:hypothetical protein
MTSVRMARREFFWAVGWAAAGAVGLLAGTRAGAAGVPNLKVGPIRRIGPEGARFFEPWIAANPRDGANLVVVGSRYLAPGKDPSDLPREPTAWFTTDGGVTWSAAELPGIAELPRDTVYLADAYATYAPDGTVFCVFCGSPKGDKLNLWIYRSDDGGRHWHGPTILDGFLDYPRLAADLAGGKPRLFVAVATPGDGPIFGQSKRSGYGCAILRSDDGARTFSAVNFLAPTTLQHDPINSPLILPDGRLLVGFADYADVPSEKGPQEHITHGRIYTATTRDGGATFTTPAPICDTLLQDGFVSLAVDRSAGPRRGRVYAVRYSRTSRPPGLDLQTSTDGSVWTAPSPVPGLRDGGIPLAAVAVSSRGVLGLSWIQGKPGEPVRPLDEAWTAREHDWDLYFTATADGGTTFAAPVLVTSSRTRTTRDGRPYATDYLSLASSLEGSFHLLWVDTQGNRCEIRTAKVTIQA